MDKYWFKAKKYGYGWYPASKKGWLVMLTWFVAFLILLNIFLKRNSQDSKDFFWYIPSVFFITFILLLIARKKGEPARWRWGDDK